MLLISGLVGEPNPTAALTWFTMAAENGSADAQYNAALMYATGQGVAQDAAKARDYFAQAAEQGLRDAQTRLGILYATGDQAGVARDYEQARFWFNRAAHRGDATAQYFLARIFADGLGVEQNLAIAHMWYELAYRFGYEHAVSSLERLRADMDEETILQSRLMAARWMRAYAEQNPDSVRITRIPADQADADNNPPD